MELDRGSRSVANRILPALLQHLRRRVVAQGAEALTDSQLIERYVTARDDLAFEVLVRRHGVMVWNVCRRLLGHEQDVEDAFQAAFLTLARKAHAIGKRECVASWLHKVAYRAALGARKSRARWSVQDAEAMDIPAQDTTDQAVWRDIRPILDEELCQLPEKYRAPFVLCYVEGKTNQEAARELRCPKGTVATRLAWARERLRTRLAGRGVCLSAGLIALTHVTATASPVPAAVIDSTVQVALLASAGNAAKGAVSIQAALLSKGVVRAMYLSKLKMVAGLMIALAVLGAGGGAMAYHGLAEERRLADSEDSSSTRLMQSESRSNPNKTLPVDTQQPVHHQRGEKEDNPPLAGTDRLQTAPREKKADLEQRLLKVEEKLEQLLRTSNTPPVMAQPPQQARASTPALSLGRELRDVDRRLQRLEEKLDKIMHLLEASRKSSP
jgi:RNA polymerase sigma factor (sigma-70 family)